MQIIEFIGLPGSGKSTLKRKIFLGKSNKYITEFNMLSYSLRDEVYKNPENDKVLANVFRILPQRLVNKYVNTFYNHSKVKYHYQNYFISENGLLLSMILSSRSFNDKGVKEKKQVISWFFQLISMYKLFEVKTIDKKILIDEGFIQKSMSLFLSPMQFNNEWGKDIEKYFELIPLPHTLIYVEVEVENSLQRLQNRGFTKRLEGIKLSQIRKYLEIVLKFQNSIIDLLKEKNVNIIKINNNKSLDNSWIELKEKLGL